MKNFQDIADKLGGVIPAVGDEFEPLTKKEVSAIERTLKRKIPPEVCKLLTTYGAFRFNEEVYYRPQRPFPKAYSKSNRGILGAFLGKLSKRYPKAKGISLANCLKLLKEEFPVDFLPIADNGAGDFLGIQLEDGSISLWIHDAPEGKDICFVNRCFNNWLETLEN